MTFISVKSAFGKKSGLSKKCSNQNKSDFFYKAEPKTTFSTANFEKRFNESSRKTVPGQVGLGLTQEQGFSIKF